MKKSFIIVIISVLLWMGVTENVNAEAKENTQVTKIEKDIALDGAKLISTRKIRTGNKTIVEKQYELRDGTIVNDKLTINSKCGVLSKNGSDSATRTRTLSGWGSITLSASFKWYTKNNIRYVKCTNMSASYTMDSRVAKSKWETSYTKDYIPFGKAKAQVKYQFYNKKNPTQYQKGTFKITCTDSGTISDND